MNISFERTGLRTRSALGVGLFKKHRRHAVLFAPHLIAQHLPHSPGLFRKAQLVIQIIRAIVRPRSGYYPQILTLKFVGFKASADVVS